MALLIATTALPQASAAQVVIGPATVPAARPVLGSQCRPELLPSHAAVAARVFGGDAKGAAVAALIRGAWQGDAAALARARDYVRGRRSTVERRLLFSRATTELAEVTADPRLFEEAQAALAGGLSGEDAAPPVVRAGRLRSLQAERARVLLVAAKASTGAGARALRVEGERLARQSALGAQEAGDVESAGEFARGTASAVVTRALAERSWPAAEAAIAELAQAVARDAVLLQRRRARLSLVAALLGLARSDAPPAVRRAAAVRAIDQLDSAEDELHADLARSPAMEVRLAQLAGDVSGSYRLPGPDEAICPLVASIAVDRAAAALALASGAPARAAIRDRLLAADAMLADAPPHRRGVFAPLLLAEAAAADGAVADATRWLDETDRRARACLCADTREAVAHLRQRLPATAPTGERP